ncbi:MAG: hypothetical protein H6672_21085 [Anaerolineaceae bacterium]|nr:hypothetical protein [Anaerolineaceae bacterium]
MTDIAMVVSVAGLFLIRVGIPVLALVTVGILVDRWQHKREMALEQEA